jgi:hypothetical protein
VAPATVIASAAAIAAAVAPAAIAAATIAATVAAVPTTEMSPAAVAAAAVAATAIAATAIATAAVAAAATAAMATEGGSFGACAQRHHQNNAVHAVYLLLQRAIPGIETPSTPGAVSAIKRRSLESGLPTPFGGVESKSVEWARCNRHRAAHGDEILYSLI